MTIQETIQKIFETQKEVSAFEDAFELIKALEQTDFSAAHGLNKTVRKKSVAFLRQDGMSLTDLDRAYQLQKKTLLFDAPHEFDAYLQYVEWGREPQKKFYVPRRKVLKTIVDDMQDLADDRLDFLAISLPPRVGKSTLGIFYLTWLMGRNPDSANAVGGHSSILTNGFYDEILNIITDRSTYLFSDVFPTARLVDKSAKETTINLKSKKRFATVSCRGIDGTWTGAIEVGNNGVLYCDDLIEDLEEALNPIRLQNKYNAYLNQMKDRKKGSAKELHIGTRWSTADIIGRINEQYTDNPRYRFRVIPALNEQNESNFDYPYGLGFNTAYYLDMKESIDDATWNAKYQGAPYVREGLLFPLDELRRYFELPGEPDAIMGICDTKDKGTDYAFLPTMYQYGNDYYMEDCICDNGEPSIVEIRLAEILIRHKVKMCRFESNSAGGKVAEKIQGMVKERGGITHITTKYTTANKETKIIINSDWIKKHVLFRDDTVISKGGEYAKALKFLGTYSMAGKNPHDDVPDGLAMFAEFVQSLAVNSAEVFQRPF